MSNKNIPGPAQLPKCPAQESPQGLGLRLPPPLRPTVGPWLALRMSSSIRMKEKKAFRRDVRHQRGKNLSLHGGQRFPGWRRELLNGRRGGEPLTWFSPAWQGRQALHTQVGHGQHRARSVPRPNRSSKKQPLCRPRASHHLVSCTCGDQEQRGHSPDG